MEKDKLFFKPKLHGKSSKPKNQLDNPSEYQIFIRRYLMLTPDARDSVRECVNNLYEQYIWKKLSNLPPDVKEKIYCIIEEASE